MAAPSSFERTSASVYRDGENVVVDAYEALRQGVNVV